MISYSSVLQEAARGVRPQHLCTVGSAAEQAAPIIDGFVHDVDRLFILSPSLSPDKADAGRIVTVKGNTLKVPEQPTKHALTTNPMSTAARSPREKIVDQNIQRQDCG